MNYSLLTILTFSALAGPAFSKDNLTSADAPTSSIQQPADGLGSPITKPEPSIEAKIAEVVQDQQFGDAIFRIAEVIAKEKAEAISNAGADRNLLGKPVATLAGVIKSLPEATQALLKTQMTEMGKLIEEAAARVSEGETDAKKAFEEAKGGISELEKADRRKLMGAFQDLQTQRRQRLVSYRTLSELIPVFRSATQHESDPVKRADKFVAYLVFVIELGNRIRDDLSVAAPKGLSEIKEITDKMIKIAQADIQQAQASKKNAEAAQSVSKDQAKALMLTYDQEIKSGNARVERWRHFAEDIQSRVPSTETVSRESERLGLVIEQAQSLLRQVAAKAIDRAVFKSLEDFAIKFDNVSTFSDIDNSILNSLFLDPVP